MNIIVLADKELVAVRDVLTLHKSTRIEKEDRDFYANIISKIK